MRKNGRLILVFGSNSSYNFAIMGSVRVRFDSGLYLKSHAQWRDRDFVTGVQFTVTPCLYFLLSYTHMP